MSAVPGRSDRLTQAFWRAPSGQGSINRLVFTRDAPIGVVPIGGRSHYRPDFAVGIEGDAGAEQAIVAFLGRQTTRAWLTEAVCDFIEEVARLLAEYGEAAYELVAVGDAGATDSAADRDTTDSATDGGATEGAAHAAGRPQQRRLELIPPRSLHVVGPLVVQIVPPGNADGIRRLIRVPRSKIFQIRLPRSLGSPRAQRQMLRRLDGVERASRRFVTATSPVAVPTGFDYNLAQRASESEVVRLTRRWGVLAFLTPKNMTGYFSVAGELYHRRAQTILRDQIVERLNALLRTEGLTEVRIEGLPDVSEIERTLDELAAGRIDLKQALEATRP